MKPDLGKTRPNLNFEWAVEVSKFVRLKITVPSIIDNGMTSAWKTTCLHYRNKLQDKRKFCTAALQDKGFWISKSGNDV